MQLLPKTLKSVDVALSSNNDGGPKLQFVMMMCDRMGTSDLSVPCRLCGRKLLVTFLDVDLWSGCYIPHSCVRLPLSR